MADRRWRRAAGVALTAFAGVAVWAALVAPVRPGRLTPASFLRIPVEALVVVGLALALRGRGRRTLAIVFGFVVAVLVVLKALDLGFREVFDRPFDPINDWAYLGPGIGVLGDSIGRPAALAVVAGVVALVLALLVLLPLCAARVLAVVGRHRRASLRAVVGLGTVWAVCAATGLQLAGEAPVASAGTSRLAYGELRHLRADLQDRQRFAREIAADPLAGAPARPLLRSLLGRPQRVPHLAHVRGRQLAGALVDPDRALGRLAAALRRAAQHAPDDAERAVPPGRLAHRIRRAGDHPRLARGRVLLRLRQALRRERRRLPRTTLRLRHHARPVHAGRTVAPRARAAAPAERDGRGGPGLQSPSVGAAAAPGALAAGR
jgi:hypothetical protein